MPPTPVAAPWYGSTADGWLCDSILNATASPSPIEMTPAFSPGPATTPSPAVGRVRSSGFELLYEQCSLHMTLNIASSRSFGSRPPRRSRIASSSSSVTPSRRWSGSTGRSATVIGLPTATAADPWAARAALSTSERMIPIPSSEPRIASAARSGCGISPATLPAAFMTPGDRPQRAVGIGRVVRSGRRPAAST